MYKPPADLTTTARDLARETRRLADVVEHLVNKSPPTRPWRGLFFSFLTGLFTILGSTLGVALFVWFLQLMGYLPYLGDLSQKIQRALGQ